MAVASAWVVTQLGGDRKSFTLSGWSAPFGRPRKDPIVEDGIELRESETYYDGDDGDPTRHIFGTKNDDYKLKGRFMDKVLGPGGANAQASYLKQFLRDAQEVTIEWGGVLTARGILKKFTPSRESSAEMGWELLFKISADTTKPVRALPQRPMLPKDMAGAIADKLSNPLRLPKLPANIEISSGLLDTIDDAISDLNTALGQFVNLANQIDTLERATFNVLSRFRGSIGQVRTAALTFQATLDSIPNDLATQREAGTSSLGFAAYRTSALVDMLAALSLLQDSDRQAEIVQRGSLVTTYTVKAGDTWESISITVYGGPSKADQLRKAAGARYGTLPTPGRSVPVPLAI